MKKVKQTTDTLSDALTRLRNAIRAKQEKVALPKTNLILEMLKVLSNYGYVGNYSVNDNSDVEVELIVDGGYRFENLERVSKPGVRKYIGAGDIRAIKGGRGLAIISTSKGVMSGVQAKKEKLGGEYLCKIW